MQANTSSPFKFLDSFTRADRAIFFGREKEIEELYARVFQSNMLLVYGASGTGKTSLIQCGLANKFNESDWMPLLVRRGDNMTRSLTGAIRNQAITPIKENARLKKCIESLYLDHFKPIYLLFDQFEELFIFGSKEEIDHFIDELKAVIQAGLSCKFIFIIRGEYLENLSRFEEQIPEFFQNRIRIEKMTRTAAMETILGPCRVFNIPVEEGFAQSLLDKISPDRSEVELTYLQVFLDKLYKLAVKRNPNEIAFRNSMLQELGNISDVLADFLEEQLATIPEANKAVSVLKSFVSTEGTKRQLSLQEAGDFTRTLGQDLTDKEIEHFVNLFVNLRILRDKDEKDKYELRHDSLAAKIYEKITLTEKELLQVRQLITNRYQEFQVRGILLNQDDLNYLATYEKQLFLDESLQGFVQKSRTIIQTNRRLKRRVSLVSLLSLMLLVGAVAFYFYQQNQLTRANELAAMSLIKVDEDPTLAYLLAEKAYALNPKGELIQKALINAYRNGPYYTLVPGGDYLLNAAGDRMVTSGSDSTLRFYHFDASGVKLDTLVKLSHEAGIYLNYQRPSDSQPALNVNSFLVTEVIRAKDGIGNIVELSTWGFNGVKLNRYQGIGKGNYKINQLRSSFMLTMEDSVYFLDKNLVLKFAVENKQHSSFIAVQSGDEHIFMKPYLFDGKVTEYDASGHVVQTFDMLTGSTYMVFAEGKEYILSGVHFTSYLSTPTSRKDKASVQKVSIYNRKGRMIATIDGFSEEISVSPDQQEFMARNDSCIGVFSMEGKRRLLLRGNFKEALPFFSPDGKYIYVKSGMEYTDMYNRSDGELLHRIKGDLVKISKDSKYGLTVDDNDRTVELYTSSGNRTTLRRKTESFADEKIAFTANNDYVVTGSLNSTSISIWKPNYSDKMDELVELEEGAHGIQLLRMRKGCMKVIDSASRELCSYAPTAQITTQWAKLSNSGKLLFIENINEFDDKCRLDLISTQDGKKIASELECLIPDNDRISNLISFDDALLGCIADSSHIALRRLKNASEIEKPYILQGLKGKPRCLSFSPATPFFVTVSNDTIVQVWRYDSQKVISRPYVNLSGHRGKVNSAVFSPDGKFILTASDDSIMRVWNLYGERVDSINEDHQIPFPIALAKFSDDPSSIIFAQYDKRVGDNFSHISFNLWRNIPYGPWLETDVSWNNMNKPEIKMPSSVSISANGRLICTTEEDFVRLRSIHGNEIFSINGMQGTFSKDAKYLYLSTGKEIHKIAVEPAEIVRLIRKEKVYGEIRTFTPREIEEYGLK